LPESLLHGMHLAVGRQPFDRGDGGTVRLDREHRARLDGLAVDQDGARAADAGLAADVRAGQIAVIAQVVDEQHARLDGVLARGVVDGDANRNGHGPTSSQAKKSFILFHSRLTDCKTDNYCVKHEIPRLSPRERLILELLAEEEMFGLQLVERSKGALKRGTVYVTLGRMQEKGLVESRTEPLSPGAIGLPRRL